MTMGGVNMQVFFDPIRARLQCGSLHLPSPCEHTPKKQCARTCYRMGPCFRAVERRCRVSMCQSIAWQSALPGSCEKDPKTRGVHARGSG